MWVAVGRWHLFAQVRLARAPSLVRSSTRPTSCMNEELLKLSKWPFIDISARGNRTIMYVRNIPTMHLLKADKKASTAAAAGGGAAVAAATRVLSPNSLSVSTTRLARLSVGSYRETEPGLAASFIQCQD